MIEQHALNPFPGNRFLLLADTHHGIFKKGNIEPPVKQCDVIEVFGFEALVKGIGGAKNCVNPWLFEIERTHNTEAQAPNFSAFVVGKITHPALAEGVL